MKVTEFLQQLKSIDREKLAQTNGIGQVIIDSLESFFGSTRYSNLVNGFAKLEADGQGLDLLIKQDALANNPDNLIGGQNIAGKVMVITGTMDIDRNQLKEKLQSYGVKVTGSVTKKTSFLLAGESSGSKYKTATELGVPIIEMSSWEDLEAFFRMETSL